MSFDATVLQIRNIDTANETFEAKLAIEQQWMMTEGDVVSSLEDKHGNLPFPRPALKACLAAIPPQLHSSHRVSRAPLRCLSPPETVPDFSPEWHPSELVRARLQGRSRSPDPLCAHAACAAK